MGDKKTENEVKSILEDKIKVSFLEFLMKSSDKYLVWESRFRAKHSHAIKLFGFRPTSFALQFLL